MPQLKFDRFDLGELTKPGATDVPLGGARVAKNVNFSSLGQLLSQKGFLLDETGPTGVVLESGIRYEWNLPSPFGRKKTWIVYGKDGGGRDEVWWKPYWDPETEAWVDAWQELTEFEGPYTMDAGTSTSQITDTELLSTVDDFYNEWVVVNITRQTSMTVDDYDEGTDVLTLKDVIASQTNGDKYFIYRFPLAMSIEGPYAADTNTTTTELIDSELKAQVDDYYNGWILVNTTRSLEVTVTDYDGQAKKLTHPVIAGQVATDAYYIYRDDHNIRVNSEKVRFFQRHQSVEISLGNDEPYPLKSPLILSFIRPTFYFQVGGDNLKFSGFWFSRNVLDHPDKTSMDGSFGTGIHDAGSGTLADVTWYFKCSYIYDGYQESRLSESFSLDPASTNEIDLRVSSTFQTSFPTSRPSFFGAVLNRRISHIRVYAAKDDFGDGKDDYFLLIQVPIRREFIKEAGFWGVVSSTVHQISVPSEPRLSDAIWDGTDFQKILSVPFGRTLRWDVAQGHSSETIHANYKFRSVLQEQVFKAPVFTDQQRDAAVNFSVKSNSDGVPADDVIPIQNIISFAFKGVTEITGLASIGGTLVIFTPNRIFIYEPGIELGEFPIERGSIAPESIIEVGNSVFFASTDDIYEFNRSGLTKLMFGKNVDQWEALTQTNKENTIAGYIKKTNSLWFLAGGTIFIYDLDHKAWRRHTTSITPVFFAADKDQTLFAITASEIYELESDLFTETINIDWESNVVDFSKESNGTSIIGNTMDVEIKFSGERQVSLLFYDTEVSETIALRTLKFFKSGIRRVDVEMAKMKLGIKTTGGGSSQPKTAIDSVLVNVDLVTNG